MGDAKISGGYILLSRKIIESEIWEKPPLYLKVWIYLLSRAQHKDYKKLKRGQIRTSIPEIQEACSWKVGFRKEKPTKDQIYQVIDLRKRSRNRNEEGYESNAGASMITTTKATHGMIITIDNYDFYQTPVNYESNGEDDNEKDTGASREQRQPNNINKNVKNDKNINDDDYDFWSNIDNKELTPEQELEKEIEEYYQAKRGKHDWPASTKDREWIKQAMKEGFTRDEMIAGITKAFLNAGEVNSFEYCLKVMRTQKKQREQWKAMKQQRRANQPPQLPKALRQEQQNQPREMTPEEEAELRAKQKLIQEKIKIMNERLKQGR